MKKSPQPARRTTQSLSVTADHNKIDKLTRGLERSARLRTADKEYAVEIATVIRHFVRLNAAKNEPDWHTLVLGRPTMRTMDVALQMMSTLLAISKGGRRC